MTETSFASKWNEIRNVRPYVHHLTNFVTVNDCANMTLSAGGSPIMTLAPEEAGDMLSLCNALVINIGTVNETFMVSALQAGKAANAQSIPVVLDPVGVGATAYRKKCIERLLEEVRFAVIRGNRSEIMTLTGLGGGRGVDADPNGPFHRENVMALARELGTVLSASGPIDFVTDGETAIEIANGHPLLADVTGTGCMTASITGCCVGAGIPALEAAALALAAIGIAGERAAEAINGERRLGSFRQRLFDEVGSMDARTMAEEAKLTYASRND